MWDNASPLDERVFQGVPSENDEGSESTEDKYFKGTLGGSTVEQPKVAKSYQRLLGSLRARNVATKPTALDQLRGRRNGNLGARGVSGMV